VDSEAKSGGGSAGQSFLVGETIYLRPLELEDAARAGAWRASPFPITRERAEQLIKEDVPDDPLWEKPRAQTLLALRRTDDVAVGSARYVVWGTWPAAEVRLLVDRAFGPAVAPAIQAEVLRLLVPYLLRERDLTTVWVYLDAGEPEALAATGYALNAEGLHEVVRFRDARWRDGTRCDRLIYETFHPAWLARFGDPAAGDEAYRDGAARQRAVRASRPTCPIGPIALADDRPRNAILVGERVYVRPFEVEDADEYARWSLREPDATFESRRPRSPIAVAAHLAAGGGGDGFQREVSLAIVLRDGDLFLGEVGLVGLDPVDRTAETRSRLVRPEYRGGGYGTEAKHLLLAYAFDVLGLHAVRSFVWGPNTRSAAALRKQGYRDAGFLHWSGARAGELVPNLAFDLLADEWRELRDSGGG
jgi:RimJ/RimL family protein N-acetyltransferase